MRILTPTGPSWNSPTATQRATGGNTYCYRSDVLYGRRTECEELLGLLARAQSGKGAARVLVGPPGVGKTTLLSWTLDQAEGFRALTCQCNERSGRLAVSALQGLVDSLVSEIEALLPEHQNALFPILGQGQASADPLALGAALVALVSQLVSDSPLLVVIDDLHWVDQTSYEALLFALPRLERDPVLVLAASRNDKGSEPSEQWPAIPIAGLSQFDVAQLLGDSVERNVADQLTRATSGNPLAVSEIVSQLSEDQRLGRAPLPALSTRR